MKFKFKVGDLVHTLKPRSPYAYARGAITARRYVRAEDAAPYYEIRFDAAIPSAAYWLSEHDIGSIQDPNDIMKEIV